MEDHFWHQRWKENQIAFHRDSVNPMLVRYFEQLKLSPGATIFLPLCGKTLDIVWLLQKGYKVIGSELSAIAIEQLVIYLSQELYKSELEKTKSALICEKLRSLKKAQEDQANPNQYLEVIEFGNMIIYVGDFFSLGETHLKDVSAIYDRAALVALPKEMRISYVKHLIEITKKSKQLLISYEYDQSQLNGPPFSVDKQEIFSHYQSNYNITKLYEEKIPGGLKGKCDSIETVWLLE